MDDREAATAGDFCCTSLLLFSFTAFPESLPTSLPKFPPSSLGLTAPPCSSPLLRGGELFLGELVLCGCGLALRGELDLRGELVLRGKLLRRGESVLRLGDADRDADLLLFLPRPPDL